jgi:putative addiction module component (TIGR02574 family)
LIADKYYGSIEFGNYMNRWISKLKGDNLMASNAEDLVTKIHDMPDTEKLKLVDLILYDLDKPDPELDKIWAKEASQRWAAYKDGRLQSISYNDVMAKYRKR